MMTLMQNHSSENAVSLTTNEHACEYLVVDSNAFIHGGNFIHMGKRFLTVPEVSKEVRDPKARELLRNFPAQIETKCPRKEAVLRVLQAGRATGDIGFLSKTDIKLLALTYELAMEHDEAFAKIVIEEDDKRAAEEEKLGINNPQQRLGRINQKKLLVGNHVDVVLAGVNNTTQIRKSAWGAGALVKPGLSFADVLRASLKVQTVNDDVVASSSSSSSSTAVAAVVPSTKSLEENISNSSDSQSESVSKEIKNSEINIASVAEQNEYRHEKEIEKNINNDSIVASTVVVAAGATTKVEKEIVNVVIAATVAVADSTAKATTSADTTNKKEEEEQTIDELIDSMMPTEDEKKQLQDDNNNNIGSATGTSDGDEGRSRVLGYHHIIKCMNVANGEEDEEEEEGEEKEDNNEDDGDSMEEDEEGSDSEGDWITSTNIRDVVDKDVSLSSEAQIVALVTSDFPMQNVALHLGLGLTNFEGRRITLLKKWILRCHCCFELVSDTTRQFCPACGSGDTLKKVCFTVDEFGNRKFWLNPKHKIKVKGTIYKLPKPRGGKWGTNRMCVLREDQLRNVGRRYNRTREGDTNNYLYDEDWLFTGGEKKRILTNVKLTRSYYSVRKLHGGKRRTK